MKKTEAERGWIRYNVLMDYIDNELVNRGLTSISQKGAEDLESFKTSAINGIARKKDADGNPVINPSTGQYEQTAWYDDYLDSDGSKTNRVVVGLGKILEDKKFMKANGNSPTWKSVQAYMNARQSIANTLMSRPFKTLNAKANADLKLVYDTIVNKLKNDDKMGFAYVYDRFLSQDLIYDKYLTPVASKIPQEGNK
jgi:hypothetical protein